VKITLISDRIPPENAGGAEVVVWNLARQLVRAGHSVLIITGTGGAPGVENRDGVQIHKLHAPLLGRWRYWMGIYRPRLVAQVRAILRASKPDVVNIHNVHGALSWGCFAAARGIPTVVTAHDMMSIAYGKLTHFIDPAQRTIPSRFEYHLPRGYNLRLARLRYNPLYRPLVHRLISRAEGRTCVSAAQRDALAANGLSGFEVVHNGIDPATFILPKQAVDAVRAEFADRPTILLAGRLSEGKGFFQLLTALEKARTQVPNAQLCLLARSDDVAAIAWQHPGIIDALYNGGWRHGEGLRAVFAAVDIVCLSSIFLDPLPTVALEGMAAGKPIIGSCFGGISEMVQDGITGYLVNPFDTDAFADRLVRLLRDPDLARQMGEAGQARVAAHFTLEQQAIEMLRVFNAAISTR